MAAGMDTQTGSPPVPDSPLRVGILGAPERVRERFAALFDVAGDGACILVEAPAAEVLLVDLDAEGARAAWQARPLRAPAVPVLFLGADPGAAPPDHRFLLKPVGPSLLLAELASLKDGEGTQPSPTLVSPNRGRSAPRARQVAPAGGGDEGAHEAWLTPWESTVALVRRGPDPLTERVDSIATGAETLSATELCGDAEDVDLADPGAVAGLFLDTDERFLGACRMVVARAAASGGAWVLRLGEHMLRVKEAGAAVGTDLTRQALWELCQAERLTEPPRIEPARPKGARGAPVERTHWESVEAFLWQMALWTYRGRLPAGTAVHGRVYLARWPNLTRIPAVPHAARVASLWLAQAVSLAFTVEVLAVPQRHVFAFYGAAHAVGLAGQARRASDRLFLPEAPGPTASRPLLGVISARLRGLVGR